MKAFRGEFSSRLGFVLAATGSAVGLGNIWGFPTNAANNGGGAFLLVYLALAFCLAYPALMAELILGRHTQANIVSTLGGLPTTFIGQKIGALAGLIGVLTASAILGFYSLVAGWMIAEFFAHGAELVGLQTVGLWFGESAKLRDALCALVFSLATITVVGSGVRQGIERWSSRLMPSLILLLIALIAYILWQPSAIDGLKVFLMPNFDHIFKPSLILSALGQAFFSLSLGVGTMLIYGSYIPRSENLPVVGALVTLVDVGVAVLAGLLVLPAMFVARDLGIEIYQGSQLMAGPDLIFQVLPTLFASMGTAGYLCGLVFFTLMTIAALTSSISMLEVPTSLLTESTPLSRPLSAWLSGLSIFALTLVIIQWFDPLFGLVVTLATEYSEPLLGIVLCIFAGWLLGRDQLLAELRHGNPNIEDSLFWMVWPFYVRIFCPLLIAGAFIQTVI